MAVANPTQTMTAGQDDPSKRDFLFIATGAIGAVGVAGAVWPLIDQMQPDAATIAAGAPLEVNIGAVPSGQQIIVKWRGHPIFIVNRPPEALKTLKDPELLSRLRDPESEVEQQPKYAENWHRSVKPEYLVLVGRLHASGLHPEVRAGQGQPSRRTGSAAIFARATARNTISPAASIPACPRPYNLPVPPYTFATDTKLVIGANPEGQAFQLDEVVQL